MNDQIQRALEVMASRGSDPGASTVWQHAFEGAVDERAHRRRVRNRSITSVIAAVSVIVIVVALVALMRKSPQRPTLSVTPTTKGHASSPGVATATAAQLISGHWSTLPIAPIPARARATVVWTGHELIVWGGATGRNQDQLRADGAAYDPATNAWRVLPAAPLSSRLGQAAVWTGTEMIVWGGYDASKTSPRATNDGAAYNPSTNSWSRLPESPLAPRTEAIAVWTGHELIVLGGQPAIVTDANPGFTDGAAYDPGNNSWHMLAIPVPLAHHPLTWDTAVQAGPKQLLAMSQWSVSRSTGPGSAQLSGGADLFRLDESTGRWTDVAPGTNALPSVEEVIWNGARAIVRGITYNCGVCPGPFVPEATALYDPATNSWTRLPPDPLGSEHMTSAWTGAALFSFNPASQSGSIGPGDATVYDPTTDRWTRLRRAPSGCDDSASPIWTGQAVLMYCPNAINATGLAYFPATSVRSSSRTTRVSRETTTSQPTSTSLAPSSEELSQRDHPAKSPPFPGMAGVVGPSMIQHHSGGPYIGARRAADIVLARYDCALGGPERGDPNTGCLEVDVRFFNHYADWWAVEGGQTQFVSSWGPDHEMYAVTIFGKLRFTTTIDGSSPTFTPWRTFQIDGANGEIMMEGGSPLPEHFAGVQTFRAPVRTGP